MTLLLLLLLLDVGATSAAAGVLYLLS